MTNETRGPLGIRDIIAEARKRCQTESIKDCLDNAEVFDMPLSRRVMVMMLKKRMFAVLITVLRFFRV